MATDRDPPDGETALENDADAAAILERRGRFIRRSMAALGTLALAGATANCAPCLTPLDGAVRRDVMSEDGAPMPCLSPADVIDLRRDAADVAAEHDGADAPDAGGADAADVAADDPDAAPMPCLSPPMDGG